MTARRCPRLRELPGRHPPRHDRCYTCSVPVAAGCVVGDVGEGIQSEVLGRVDDLGRVGGGDCLGRRASVAARPEQDMKIAQEVTELAVEARAGMLSAIWLKTTWRIEGSLVKPG